jgi:hypothetical protein
MLSAYLYVRQVIAGTRAMAYYWRDPMTKSAVERKIGFCCSLPLSTFLSAPAEDPRLRGMPATARGMAQKTLVKKGKRHIMCIDGSNAVLI